MGDYWVEGHRRHLGLRRLYIQWVRMFVEQVQRSEFKSTEPM